MENADVDTAEPDSSSQYTASSTISLVFAGKGPDFDRVGLRDLPSFLKGLFLLPLDTLA